MHVTCRIVRVKIVLSIYPTHMTNFYNFNNNLRLTSSYINNHLNMYSIIFPNYVLKYAEQTI